MNLFLRVAGEVSDDLRRQADRFDIGDAVAFLGKLDTEDLPEFYRGIDILLIPSRQEGLNIAGLEAGACGVPVVTTRCGGPEDYVTDGETGFVRGFDPPEIADRLCEIYADRALRDTLSRNIRVLVEAEYGEDRFAERLDRLWRSIWNEQILDVSPPGIVGAIRPGV